MKKHFHKIIFLLPAIFCAIFSFGQVKKLNDPSIVAHQKRMVFESWGDFRPYPKYTLGIQTNFAYATVWGWLSPSKNQDYKNGAVASQNAILMAPYANYVNENILKGIHGYLNKINNK